MLISVPLILGTSLLAGFLLIFARVAKYFAKLHKISSALRQFPHDKTHWFWGDMRNDFPGFNKLGLSWLREKAARHPRYSAVWRTMFLPTLTLRHPDVVKTVLKRSDPKAMDMGYYRFGRSWLLDGILFSSGQKWQRTRKLLTPAFHFDILRPYLDIDNEAVENLLDKMEDYSNRGESMESFYNISLCTLEIIMRCAFSFGAEEIQREGENHPYVQAVGVIADVWVKRVTSLVGQFDFLWNRTQDAKAFYEKCDYVHKLSMEVIANRRATLKEQGASAMRTGKYLDFLDLMLMCRDENGEGLSDRELLEEVTTFMFAGHDTTASSLTWTLYSLACNPEHQKRCRQEVDEILEGRDSDVILSVRQMPKDTEIVAQSDVLKVHYNDLSLSPGGTMIDLHEHFVESEDLPKFKYLTMCIKEAQRLHVPVPFIARELAEDLELDGKHVPAGTVVDIQLYTLHHNPTVWEDSMEYRPERFLPENISKKHSYAFIPFSAGPRNCLGQHFSMQEQKVILGRILRRYEIGVDPNFNLDYQVGLVTRPKDGLKLIVKKRE